MKKELDEALVRDFPLLFKSRYSDPLKTAMCWGFDCGDGWEPILRNAANKLEFIIKQIVEQNPIESEWAPQAVQVKEKYGTLRLYLSTGNDEMWKIIEELELQSSNTCEECGSPGKLRGTMWLYTACDNHDRDKNG